MNELLNTFQSARLYSSWIGLILFVILENIRPFATQREPLWRHYFRNIVLAVFNVGVGFIVWRGLLVAAPVWAEANGFGLMNWLGLKWGWKVAATVVAFDALTYGMHVAYHWVPLLWRLHQVHHTDLDFDVTTASRFHPGEILLSTGVQIALATVLGAAPEGIVLFQILLLVQAQAQHSNVVLPDAVDWVVRMALVTPNMHRIHHSVIVTETNSNYATISSVWDRLGQTLITRPQTGIDIGLSQYSKQEELGLWNLLVLPFRTLRNAGS